MATTEFAKSSPTTWDLAKSPVSVFFVTYTLQWLLWLLAFPESPTVEEGEPKSATTVAVLLHITCALSFISLSIAGLRGKTSARDVLRPAAGPKHDNTIYKIGYIICVISCTGIVLRLAPAYADINNILNILQPYALNKAHSTINAESIPLSGVVSQLWLSGYTLIRLSTKNREKGRSILTITIVLVLLYSTLGMTRLTIISLILIEIFMSIYFDTRRKRIRKLATSITLLLIIVVGGSLIRTGTATASREETSILTPKVLKYVASELNEKYFAGELNSSLLLMSYETTPTNNWASGTFLSAYFPPEMPNRSFNTMHAFGRLYWAFGALAPIAAGILGFTIGSISRLYLITRRENHIITTLYALTFIGTILLFRINFFFSIEFLSNVFILIAVGILTSKNRMKGPQHNAHCI